jgi:hypothetical protein
LCTLRDELEEVKLASPPPEPTENELLDAVLDTLDRVSLLPELEIQLPVARYRSQRSPARRLDVIFIRL